MWRNSYSGKSFNYEPKTKSEYFELLKNLKKLENQPLIKLKKQGLSYIYTDTRQGNCSIVPGQKIGKDMAEDFSTLIDNYDEKDDFCLI